MGSFDKHIEKFFNLLAIVSILTLSPNFSYADGYYEDSSDNTQDAFILDTPAALALTQDHSPRFQAKREITPNDQELSLAEKEQELLKKMAEAGKEDLDKKIEITKKKSAQEAELQIREEESDRKKIINKAERDFDIQGFDEKDLEQIPEIEQGEAALTQKPREDKSLSRETDLVEKNLKVQRELTAAYEKLSDLTQKLDEAKRQLLLAETQVERLTKIIDSKGLSRNQEDSPLAKMNKRQTEQQIESQRNTYRADESNRGQNTKNIYEEWKPRENIPQKIQSNSSTPIVTIIDNRTALRTAASDDSSVVSYLPQGTKLPVVGRQGTWLRVIDPNGVLAWIPATAVGSSKTNSTSGSNTNPYRPSDSEEKAMDLLRRSR